MIIFDYYSTLNDYFQFVVEKGYDIKEPDRSIFRTFFEDLNRQLDNENDFVSILIKHDVCVNFVFFAIFDSKQRSPAGLKVHYDDIYTQCEKNINDIGFIDYRIEIVFVPTESSTMELKQAMEKSYE